MKLHIVFFVALLCNAHMVDSCGYFRHMRQYPKSQEELDRDLLHKCQNLEEGESLSEYFSNIFHFRSAQQGRLQEIERDLKKGANPNRIFPTTTRNDEVVNWSSFQASVQDNNPALVALLLKYKGNPNLSYSIRRGSQGEEVTPLGLVAKNCRTFYQKNTNSAQNTSIENCLIICGQLIQAGAKPTPNEAPYIKDMVQAAQDLKTGRK